MLLKVDVYPSTTGEAYPGTTREPEETVYVCLATSSTNSTATGNDNDTGRLLTVGRKSGDIMLGKDKSVSREHCVIRIVTTNKTLPKGKAAPLPARTLEEQKACQESSFYQCSIVLESVGRLGTFIVEETPLVKKTVANDNDDDDSDTDEEAEMMISQSGGGGVAAASQASQLPLSAWVRNVVAGGNDSDASASSRPIRTRLIHNSTILKELDSDTGRVVVLCGKQESILVLTRVPIYVQRTKTSFPKSSVPSWWSELYTTGAVDLSDKAGNLLSPQTTHLITSARSSSLKQLCAWVKGIHIVQAEYLQALLQRKSPRDAFPNAASFVPPCPPGQEFWEQRPVGNVWAGLKYISMKRDDEWPDLVRAMGGTVCRLDEEARRQAGNNSVNGKEEERIYGQILSQLDPSSTWSVEIKGRKYTQPLKEANIPLYNAKEVAKAVTTWQVLPGLTPNTSTSKVVFETQSIKTRRAAKSSTQADTSTIASPNPSTTTAKENADSDSKLPVKKESHHEEDSPLSKKTDATKTASQSSRRAARSLPSSDSESDSEPVRRRSPRRNTQRSTQKSVGKENNSDSDSDSEPGRRNTQRSTQKSDGDEKSSEETKKSHEPPVNTVALNAKDEPKVEDDAPPMDADNDPLPGNDDAEIEDNMREGEVSNTEKRELEKTDERPMKRVKRGSSAPLDGWLQAAPPGQKRRTKEEMAEVYEGDNVDLYTNSAVTEWAPKPTAKKVPSGTQAASRRRRDAGPNFKGFRKNRVPPVQIVQYKWQSHRSVPAVQQAQMEEEQREADLAFQRANELFKDVARSTASSRRRKLQ